MIWKIVGLVGAGSFIINGLSVISNPNCVTVDFGGQSRIVTINCYDGLGGAIPGTTAGMLLIICGLLLLTLIFWKNIKIFFYIGNNENISKTQLYSREKKLGKEISAQVISLEDSTPRKKCKYCKNTFLAELGNCPDCFPKTEWSMESMDDKVCKYCKKSFLAELGNCPDCFPKATPGIQDEFEITQKAPPEKGTFVFKTLKEDLELETKVANKSATPVIAATPEYKTCPMCAEKIRYAAKKCRYCQHMLDV